MMGSPVIDRLLVRSPLHSLSERRAGQRLAVLGYHGVDDARRFAEQVEYVYRHLHPVALADVLDTTGGGVLPDRAILITFDDGRRSVLENALPILQARGIPAAVFVVAGLLDTDEPFWWDEVKALVRNGGRSEHVPAHLAPEDAVRALKRVPNEARLDVLEQLRRTAAAPAPRCPQLRREELPMLEAGGITVGNHTLTHPCLHQCDEATIRHELEASQALLTEALGHTPRSLAYPNGDHDPRVRRVAEALGFEAAFLFDHRLSTSPPADPLRISRLRVDVTTSMDRFRITLSGLHPAIHHLLGRA